MKQTLKAIHFLVRLPLYLAVGWALGFGWFWANLPVASSGDTAADGIVVLTGGRGRIEYGLDLLASKRARRMLISGVHPSVPAADLYSRGENVEQLFACCIDLGRNAENTTGNAVETKAWAEAHAMQRLIVITADYHMPRAMVLFSRAMPDLTLVPAAAETEPSLTLLVNEYNKYLFELVRQASPL